MTYVKGDAFIGSNNYEGVTAIMLPHSCDEWIIGGADAARQLIEDLQALIPEMEEIQAAES